MLIAVGTEARFTRGPDGIIRSDTGGRDYNFWRRYLDAFDGVVVVARVAKTSHTRGSAVSGEGVTVSALDNYVGLKGWARHLSANHAKMRKVCIRSDMAYLVRVPGLIGSMMINALRRQGRPFGLEVVGDPAAVFRSGIITGPIAGALGLISARQTRRQCAVAQAVSYVTRDQLQKQYPSTGAQFVTHYSSVDLPDDAFVDRPRDPCANIPVLVSVGGMSQRYKGYDVLLRAIAHLAREGMAFEARFIGDGRLRAELEDLARDVLVADRVTFVGQVQSGPAVRAELDRADIFVLPSRTEGLPRALIEAMARGLPCVASKVGGIPELLCEEDMVPPDDPEALAMAISSVLAGPHRHREMAERNLQRARDYSRERLEVRRTCFYKQLRALSEAHND